MAFSVHNAQLSTQRHGGTRGKAEFGYKCVSSETGNGLIVLWLCPAHIQTSLQSLALVLAHVNVGTIKMPHIPLKVNCKSCKFTQEVSFVICMGS